MHCAHSDYRVCAAFVAAVNQHTGGLLKYCGTSPGDTMASAFDELCRPQQRQGLSVEVRAALCRRQAGLCADCGDELKGVGSYEVDHRVPLCFGGSNDSSNLAAACGACHARKSYHENINVVDRCRTTQFLERPTSYLYVVPWAA